MIYFLGSDNNWYNQYYIAFNESDSVSGIVLKEILSEKYQLYWDKIMNNEEVIILNDDFKEDFLDFLSKKLTSYLKNMNEEENGNYEIEFNGITYSLSKLSENYRVITKLHSLYQLFSTAVKHKTPIYFINVDLLQDLDYKYVLDIIFRKINHINLDNVEKEIIAYLKEQEIEHSFTTPITECINVLMKKGFLKEHEENKIVKFQLTEGTRIIKSKPQ